MAALQYKQARPPAYLAWGPDRTSLEPPASHRNLHLLHHHFQGDTADGVANSRSCTRRSLEHCGATRRWRTSPCGCQRRTSRCNEERRPELLCSHAAQRRPVSSINELLRGQLNKPKKLRQLFEIQGLLESQWFAPGRHVFRVVQGDTWKLRAFLSPRLPLLAPFRSREPRIRRLSDTDGFPPDPLHEAIACAQVSCLFVHEVSEHYGPVSCEVVSAIRFGREGVHFEHDLPLHWWIHHLEFIADGAGATNSMVITWWCDVGTRVSRMSTSHFMVLWKDVSWIPLASLPNETCQDQHFRATETLGADSDDVSVWEFIGLLVVGTFRSRFELCVED